MRPANSTERKALIFGGIGVALVLPVLATIVFVAAPSGSQIACSATSPAGRAGRFHQPAPAR